jgi:hypothetical protein
MKHVSVTRQLPVAPDRAYAYLAEHENLTGAVPGLRSERLNDGTDGTRNGMGSKRKLSVGGLAPFEETIVEAIPGELIRYRITKGSPLRDQEGEIRLCPSGSGTEVTWSSRFRSAIPGGEGPLAKVLETVFGRALAAAAQRA